MRYDRQILMAEIGIEGQKKLGNSVVTVVGCGGLGRQPLSILLKPVWEQSAWWTETWFLNQI